MRIRISALVGAAAVALAIVGLQASQFNHYWEVLDDGSVIEVEVGDDGVKTVLSVTAPWQRDLGTPPQNGTKVLADGSIIRLVDGQVVEVIDSETTGIQGFQDWGDHPCTTTISGSHICWGDIPPAYCGYYSLTEHTGPGTAAVHMEYPCEEDG